MTKDVQLIDAQHNPFMEDGKIGVKTEQHIPDSFLDGLKESRAISETQRCGDFHHVASIPVGVVAKMYREGLDFYRDNPNDIIKWLRRHGYENLFATAKNITFQEN